MIRTFLFLMLFVPMAAQAATNVKLILNWKPEAEFGGFYAAEQSKAFEKEKLKVDILPGGVGTPAVQMVAAGKAEFGISSADEVIIAQDRGADVVALFAVYQTNPQGIMIRASRDAKDISQTLRSGSLAVQKGLPYFQFLEKKYGPIQAKVVPFLGGITQIAQDANVAQQCFVTSEPILAEKKNLPVKVFFVADAGFNPYTAVVVTRRGYAQKNPATVAAFKRAITEGWKQYLQSPDPANAVMHKLNPTMDMETLDKSAKIQAPLIETDVTKKEGLGSMREERWEDLAEQLKALKLVTKSKPASEYLLK